MLFIHSRPLLLYSKSLDATSLRLLARLRDVTPAGAGTRVGKQSCISSCAKKSLGPPPSSMTIRGSCRRHAFGTCLDVNKSRPFHLNLNHMARAMGNTKIGAPLFSVGRLNPRLPNNNIMLGSSHFASLRVYYSSNQNNNQRPPIPPRNRLSAGIGMLGAGGLLIGKGKYILGALKLTKFASLGSMLLTVGAYTAFYGFPYAVGMTSLILIHESGHALTMKRLGIPFSPMVFIPFMGAAVAMKKRPRDAYQEALVAFGGPVLGSLGALGFAGAGHLTDSHLLFALADFGFMINLFNMIPLGMMDGGRICGAISPYAGLVGLGLGGTMAYQGMISNPIFYLILLGGGYETFMRLYDPLKHAPANYYRISGGKRAAITGGYFSLVGALFLAMSWNRQYMVPPEQLERRRIYFS